LAIVALPNDPDLLPPPRFPAAIIRHGIVTGDGYLRKLLVHGARTVLLWSRRKKEERSRWQEALLARRPTNVVLVAMANKTARVVWALLSRREVFCAKA